jgi:hypothetical protein
MAVKLSTCIRALGYAVVITAAPARVRGGLGQGSAHMCARSFYTEELGYGVAIKGDSWEYAYNASHEIAEMRNGFQHSALMFSEQANFLHAWHMLRSGRRPRWLKLGKAA